MRLSSLEKKGLAIVLGDSALKREAADEMYEALKELLRVDDAWHGSVNSEMAQARNAARAALAKADGK